MTPALIHIRTDAEEKKYLQRAADRFGLPLSTFVLKAAKQVAEEGELRVTADLVPSPYLLSVLEKSAKEEPAATFTLPDQQEEMFAFLDSLVDD